MPVADELKPGSIPTDFKVYNETGILKFVKNMSDQPIFLKEVKVFNAILVQYNFREGSCTQFYVISLNIMLVN
jgi:hypothetical protein